MGGEKVALKRVRISIPAGHDLSGLTFVIRSADSTAWWRDGEHCASCCGVQCHSNTSRDPDYPAHALSKAQMMSCRSLSFCMR